MQIIDNQIIYANHIVECDPTIGSAEFMLEYVQMMADSLSADGSANDHIIELDDMNNDGSWTVIFK